MSPTLRTAVLVAVVAASALVVSATVALLGLVIVLTLLVVDLSFARGAPTCEREINEVMARGVPSPLVVHASSERSGHVRIRQPAVPDLAVEPPEADDTLDGRIVPRRRGRHTLPAVATRSVGPLGLGAWYRTVAEPVTVDVYPDLPAARQLAQAVRLGRFRAPGSRTRGPLGLGTDFESVRDYEPDDDIRQVNWRASARIGRAMSNQYRVESERDVILLVDAGRLMASPLGSATRLDVALDALAAVALVADEVGDRCGVVAFDREIVCSRSPVAPTAVPSCGPRTTWRPDPSNPTTTQRFVPWAPRSVRSCSFSPTSSTRRQRDPCCGLFPSWLVVTSWWWPARRILI
ncbi:MAG: DUF58 domain-containing protein [Acidimicrobiia bacterium]|nr:DUF58 domain-containing protein [Acidimicrobiia bacterium]